jgi:hypothetical protein
MFVSSTALFQHYHLPSVFDLRLVNVDIEGGAKNEKRLVKATIPIFLSGGMSPEKARAGILEALQTAMKNGAFESAANASSDGPQQSPKHPLSAKPERSSSSLQHPARLDKDAAPPFSSTSSPAGTYETEAKSVSRKNTGKTPNSSVFQSASPLEPLFTESPSSSQPTAANDAPKEAPRRKTIINPNFSLFQSGPSLVDPSRFSSLPRPTSAAPKKTVGTQSPQKNASTNPNKSFFQGASPLDPLYTQSRPASHLNAPTPVPSGLGSVSAKETATKESNGEVSNKYAPNSGRMDVEFKISAVGINSPRQLGIYMEAAEDVVKSYLSTKSTDLNGLVTYDPEFHPFLESVERIGKLCFLSSSSEAHYRR